MLNQPLMEKLLAMRLHGMLEALKVQEQDRAVNELSFLERLALLVDQQWSWRENQALTRRLKAAKLRGAACVEDIDYRAARGLDKTVLRALAKDSIWVRNHENIFVIGPCGVGKSFLASALAQKACRDGYSALYFRAAALSRDLALARADGSLRHLLTRLGRIDVLVIDDWAMAPLSEVERRDIWEICEDRYQTRSTVLTSQLPVSRWHEQIGDPTIADGILDRLVHNAHRIEMRGESMRKNAIRRRTRRRNETPTVRHRAYCLGSAARLTMFWTGCGEPGADVSTPLLLLKMYSPQGPEQLLEAVFPTAYRWLALSTLLSPGTICTGPAGTNPPPSCSLKI